MPLFRRRQSDDSRGHRAEIGTSTAPSKILAGLVLDAERSVRRGAVPRVLVFGAPSGGVIERIHAIGCRVTVEGDDKPSIPLPYDDGTFDLVLGMDVLDFLDRSSASTLLGDWKRILAPSGRLYFVSRHTVDILPRTFRLDVDDGGQFRLIQGGRPPSKAREHWSNRKIAETLAPTVCEEICLRRDGLREFAAKKPAE